MAPVRLPKDAPVTGRAAVARQPAGRFDHACGEVLAHLAEVAPMGAWTATRVVRGRQVLLTVQDRVFGLRTGAEFDFAATMCGSMAAGRTPQIAPDTAAVPQYLEVAARYGVAIGAYMGIPIVQADGSLFGTVCGLHPTPLPATLLCHQPLLGLLSNLLSAVLHADTEAVAVARELERSRYQADTDVLTGLLNRRGWDRFIACEEQRFRRFGDVAGVVIIDLDRLKAINDSQGHEAGDLHLKAAASALREAAGAGDVVARLGGDEFGIIAVGAGATQVARLLRRLDRALHAAGVSGSMGHAPYNVATGFAGAWRKADQDMYEHKRRRRTRRSG